MKSSLVVANHISWQADFQYSWIVARELARGRSELERARKGITGYRAVVGALQQWQHTIMAPQQLQSLHYMLGIAHGQLGEYDAALEHFSRALDVVRRLRTRNEPDAVLASYELLYLRATHARAINRYADASRDLRMALTLLQEFLPADQETLPSLQLPLYAQLAGFEFFQGNFESSQHALSSARKLVPLAPELQYEAALVTWAEAHLARTRGQPELALQDASSALPLIAQSNAPTQVRFHAFLAELALDAVERRANLRHTREYDHYMRAARHHAKIADDLAFQGSDISGWLLAWLIRMRQYRFAGRNYDRVRALEQVIWEGQRIHDHALLVHAMLTLGDEFAFLHMPESALTWYSQAVGASDGSQEFAIGHHALRRVMTAHKWRTDNRAAT